MRADEDGKERYVVPEGHFDGYDGYVRSEWELRKIMECNIVLSMHEIHHIRKLTTVVDALGKLGGINALLMASAAVFFAPIAQFLFDIDTFEQMFKIQKPDGSVKNLKFAKRERWHLYSALKMPSCLNRLCCNFKH